MESKQIRSSLISRSIQRLHQEKLRVIERQNKLKGFSQSKSESGFTVIPTKELCRVYLYKPNLLASKGIIDARAKPPHSQNKGSKSMGSKIYKFGRRHDQQNLKSRMRHHTIVDPLKPKILKKESSLRCFSPLGFSSGDRKKVQYLSLDKKPKEVKKLCDGKEERVLREVSTKMMVRTSRDSGLSLKRTCNDRVLANVKLRHVSSSGFISKDDKEDSLNCSNASPDCQKNSEEAHQPSPVSVLEPMFQDDTFDDSEELPHLNFHESESFSDGSGMEISSEEEFVLDSETKENKESEPIVSLNTEEKRDSSYIDDILAEVVLRNNNGLHDSTDLDIYSEIFEKLEKKYYTENTWKKSERRMLFDRVSSSLVEILESFTATPTWKKPVSMRLGAVLSTCGLKQELWKVLSRQEKQSKKESLAKMPIIDINEWLDLEANDEPVVYELASMIVDELLSEVVSFM